MKTGFVWHEMYAWHETGMSRTAHGSDRFMQPILGFEHADTKRRIYSLIEVSGLIESLVVLKPRLATLTELGRFHTEDYLEKLKTLSDGSGDLTNASAPFGPGSFEIAQLATGGCLVALEAILNRQLDNAYALVRPPGHHAEKDEAKGFCLFANVALSVMHAQAVYGLNRIAVVDYDVHHGNGTEHAFYDKPAVLTISVHQDGCFPADSGALSDNGIGAGLGTAINIPLPAGSGHGAYLATFDEVILPALYRFKPELIVVASGFDASALDPLSQMMCYADTYREVARALMEAARELCQNRLLFCHEGGYSAHYVPFCALAVLEQLSGQKTEVKDPYADLSQRPGQALQRHQAEVIKQASDLVKRIPN